MSVAAQTCACGCGELVKPGRSYRWGHSGHKWSSQTGRAARARVRSRPVVEVADPFPEDAGALARLIELTQR